MQTPYPMLLADLEEVLKGLLPIIFVVLYGVAHLFGALQQEKKKPKPKPRPRPAPPQMAGGKPAANQGNLEDSLRREVEDFLRRAQGQPQQQRPAQAPPPKPQTRYQPKPSSPKPQQPRPQQRPPLRPLERERQGQFVEAVVIEPAAAPLEPSVHNPGSPPPAGSPRHIGDPLRSQLPGLPAHALGTQVAQADERMEEHLRKVFVHQVGTLAPPTGQQGQQVASTPAAQEIRNLISRPGGMRQLVIAGEILRPPEERWQHLRPQP